MHDAQSATRIFQVVLAHDRAVTRTPFSYTLDVADLVDVFVGERAAEVRFDKKLPDLVHLLLRVRGNDYPFLLTPLALEHSFDPFAWRTTSRAGAARARAHTHTRPDC